MVYEFIKPSGGSLVCRRFFGHCTRSGVREVELAEENYGWEK